MRSIYGIRSKGIICLLLALLIFLSILSGSAFSVEGKTSEAQNTETETQNPDSEAPPIDDDEIAPDSSGVYANSISGMLWLDMYDDAANGIYAGDAAHQAEEIPIEGYTVYLYEQGNMSAAVRTAITDANGNYEFTDIDPGTYVVGVGTVTMDGVEYLLPFWYLTGTEGDNRFAAAYDPEADAYLYAYTAPIELAEDTVAADMNAGMRAVPQIAPHEVDGIEIRYIGKLLKQDRTPWKNVTVSVVVLYRTGTGPAGWGYRIIQCNTDDAGIFNANFSPFTGYNIAEGEGQMYVTLSFQGSPFSEGMIVSHLRPSVRTEGTVTAPLFPYSEGVLSRDPTANSTYGAPGWIYPFFMYELKFWDDKPIFYIGTSEDPHEVKINVGSTVTEKFVDEDDPTGTALKSENSIFVEPSSSYTSTVTPEDLPIEGYIYKGYKMGSYSPGDPLDGTGIPTDVTLTGDTDVYFVYHRINDNYSVTVPAAGNFHVDETTYPNVLAGRIGDTGVYYTFSNSSDKPVTAEFVGMTVTDDAGLTFVQNASGNSADSNSISLALNLATPTGLTQGLTNGVGNIDPSNPYTAEPVQMGTLNGVYVAPYASQNGYITIGGYYAGYLSPAAKNPRVKMCFNFSIIP